MLMESASSEKKRVGAPGLKAAPASKHETKSVNTLKTEGALVIAAGFFAFITIYTSLSLLYTTPRDSTVDVKIPSGIGYRRALSLFHEKEVIQSEFPLLILGRFAGVEKTVRPGLYRIPKNATPLDVFYKMRYGETETITLTVPEGYNLEEIAMAVEKAGFASKDEFLRYAKDQSLTGKLGFNAPTFEGFLFPDTYKIPVDAGPEDIITIMVNRFRKVFGPEFKKQLTDSGMTTLQVVTLASIVEKEARENSERGLIAAVYLNRLKKRMRLEADPTILYGVRSAGKPIRRSEIRRRTPYNTYVIKGLPPGPIANPGLESIKAVLYPADVDYLYFVAKNDGTHHFSKTLREHNRAVKKYQR